MRSFSVFVLLTLLAIGGIGLLSVFGPPGTSIEEVAAPVPDESVRVDSGPETVSPPTPIQVVANREATFEERFEALHEIVLTPESTTVDEDRQVQTLISVLQDSEANSTLRNDVVLVLARDGVPRPGLGAQLVSMWRNPAEDPVWRDYCLQHLETVFDLDPSNQPAMRAALFAAAELKPVIVSTPTADPDIETAELPAASAATALLALERLSERYPDLKPSTMKLAQTALTQAAAYPDCAVSALQIVARDDHSAALEKARRWAGDAEQPARLRMSALAVLGAHGDKATDMALLRQAAVNKDFRLASAGKAGLAVWNRRHATEQIQ